MLSDTSVFSILKTVMVVVGREGEQAFFAQTEKLGNHTTRMQTLSLMPWEHI